jgi:hypothetical protein
LFVVRFYNRNFKDNEVLNKTIAKLSSLVKSKRKSKTRIIKDSSCVEIISGNLNASNIEDEVIVELTTKKILRISKEQLQSKHELDRFIREIESFCNQASESEEVKYLPLNFREFRDKKTD